jgi:hypothetical protein
VRGKFSLLLIILLIANSLLATDYYLDTDAGTDQAGCGDTAFGADACKTGQYLDDLYDADITGATSVVIHCKGATDDGAWVVTGWTTNSTHTITIKVDQADRHAGVYDDSKYQIACTNNASGCFAVLEDYVTTDGLQVGVTTSTTGYGMTVQGQTTTTNDIRISNTLFVAKSMSGTGAAAGLLIIDADAIVTMWNNIAYGFVSGGDNQFSGFNISNSATVTAYNITSAGNYSGIIQTAGTVTCTNCLVFNNTDDFTGTVTNTYSATDDDADRGANGQDLNENASGEWTANTPNYATFNYALGASGVSVENGTDDPGAAVQENNDIRGASYPRSSTWDIGAFEYIATGTTPRRVIGGGVF